MTAELDGGTVSGRLELNIKGWVAAVDKVKKDQQSLSGLVMRHDKQLKDLGKTFTVAGTAMVASLSALVIKTADAGEGVLKLSKQTGITTEFVSGLKLALDKSGTSTEAFGVGMKGLSNLMVEAASGGKEAKALFKDIGVSATDSAKKLRPLEDVVLDLADRFAAMPDGPMKSALAVKVFGKAGTDLIPVLNLGRKGIEENLEASQKLGLVWSKDAAEAAGRFNDSLAELKGGLQGVGMQIGTALMPVLEGAIKNLQGFVGMVKDAAAAHPSLIQAVGILGLAFGGIGMTTGPLLMMLPKLVTGFNALKAMLGTTALGVNAFMGALTVSLGVIILYISKLQELGAAEDYVQVATRSLWDTENKIVDSLSKAAVAAGWEFGAMSKLLANRKGNIAELVNEIREGKHGVEIKEALAKVSKKEGDEIDRLRKLTGDLTFGQKALNEELGLTLRIDMEKKYKDLLTALTLYKGQLTVAGERKMMDDLIALRSELDNTKPSIISLDDVITKLFDDIDKSISEADLAGWNDELAAHGKKMQRDFEVSTDGIVQDILQIVGTADQVIDKFKLFGDAIGVSARTVAVEMYNIQATILRTMGILVPVLKTAWEPFSFGLIRVAEDTKTAFENCADDIAKAFGEAFASIIKDGLNFGNLFKSLMQGIINTVATYVGTKLTTAFANAFDGIAIGAKAAAAGATASLGSIAAALGTVLLVVAAVGMAIASVVSIFSFFLGKDSNHDAEFAAEVARVNALTEAWKAQGLTIDEINQKLHDMSNVFAAWGTAPAIDALGNPIVDSTPLLDPWAQARKDLADAMAGGVEGAKPLDEAWSNLISKAKELGLEGSKAFVDLILKMREAGQTSKVLTEYVLGQLDTIPNALQTLTDNMAAAQNAYIQRIPEIAKAWDALKLKTPKLTDEDFWTSFKKGLLPDVPPEVLARFKKGMDGYAQVAIVTFEGMIANGRSWIESLTALEGPLASLKEQYKNLGQSIPAFLKPMFDALDIKKKHPAIFQNLDAATSVLTGMRNAAYMTQGSFNALVSSAAKFASAILGAHGNLNTFLKTAKLTGTQVQQLLPTVSQFVGAAASFALGIPAWMKTFVTKNLPGISWEAFKEKAAAQANAGVATVEELKKIVLTSDATSKELLNFKSYFDASAPWVTRIVDAIGGIPAAGSGSTGSSATGTAGGPGLSWTPGGPGLPPGPKTSNVNLTFNINALDGADVVRITRKVIIPEIQKFYRHGGMIPASAVGGP